MSLTEHERREALGKCGEKKALILLKNARFNGVKDVNAETHNHPFGDIYAEFALERFVIGVKTRNMYQKSGPLNASYNVLKKGFDVWVVGRRYQADLAWVAIQVIPELQTFNAYFGTIDKIQEYKERFSIPMKPDAIRDYKCMRLAAEDEFDPSIRLEWSNGGYSAHCKRRRSSSSAQHLSR
jgi:hypothetical protein